MNINENINQNDDVNDDIPIPLPHYTIRNYKLLFMDYKEKALDAALLDGFSKITGQYSIGVLWEKYHIPLETVLELEKKRLIVIKKGRKQQKKFKTKIGVISPHYDDTVFSLGGIVNKHINEIDWRIINVFGKQDYTLYAQFYGNDKNKNFALHEEKIAFALMGLDKFDYWDIEEAMLRSGYKGYDFMQNSMSPYAIIKAEQDCYNILCDCIKNARSVNECDIIICPLGIGHHVDHILVRQACIQMFLEKKPIVFYEDLPYSLRFETQPVINWLNSFLGVRLEQKLVNITEFAQQKQYLVGVYQSQVRISQVKAMVRHGFHNNQYYEKVWVPEAYEKMPF